MKRAASSASGNGRAQDKRGGGGGGGRRRQKLQQAGKLQKMGLAVREFVEAASSSHQDGFPSPSEEAPKRGPPASHSRRNRREQRREKRKMKRVRRRRRLLDGEEEPAAKGPRPPRPASTAASREEEEKPKPPKAKGGLKTRPRAPKEKPPCLSTGEGQPPPPSRSPLGRKRALLAANEAEEREIRRLERQLGLHKRRRRRPRPGEEEDDKAAPAVPQSFVRDGLGYVLGALGSSGGTLSGLYESSEEEAEEGEEEEGHGGEAEEGQNLPEESEEGEDEEGSAWGGEERGDSSGEGDIGSDAQDTSHSFRSSGDEAGDPAPPQSQEENLSQSVSKYIPPQLRQSEEILDAKKREELERLKKTVKGLINRLSEQNLASICGQLEELYMANSRKDMNETLTNIVISACVTSAAMPPRLVMEHVLLISVLHQTVGIEVGAHFLETVVRKFDEIYKSETEGKECENLLTLIAHLYNFHVMHSLLIFDILKKLVSTFSAKDIELILLFLKNVGFSLRKDDALALKELITEAQKKANTEGKQFQDQSRVCFMLEIMLALKNNDMRKIPGYDPEPVEKLRKLMRTLVHGASSGKDAQLRVSLKSLLSADQVGRWWIVGSSWSGTPMISSTSNKIQQILSAGKVSSEILKLARKQRMNTDIRRNIFCILMTCEDFLDAFEKLLKLGLKDQQEREIVHVLIDCCLQEKTYNPFYAYLSAKFCEYERRFQMTFQFSMWDKIKDLENLSASASSNLVHLLVHLLKIKCLSLAVFKVIEFSELDKPKVHFLRQVLSALLIQTDPEELNYIFGKLADNPKLGMLLESLKLFLTHFLLKNTRALKSVEETTLLKEKIELVTKALKAKESRLKL